MLKIKVLVVMVVFVVGIIGIQSSCTHESTYKVCFNTEVLPIFQSNCAMSGCHDAITAEKDIILTDYENIMKEVKAGNPSGSEVYKVLLISGEEGMPPSPKNPLTSEQISTIRSWIQQGAKNDPTCQ